MTWFVQGHILFCQLLSTWMVNESTFWVYFIPFKKIPFIDFISIPDQNSLEHLLHKMPFSEVWSVSGLICFPLPPITIWTKKFHILHTVSQFSKTSSQCCHRALREHIHQLPFLSCLRWGRGGHLLGRWVLGSVVMGSKGQVHLPVAFPSAGF
jgi:hypothetical protein